MIETKCGLKCSSCELKQKMGCKGCIVTNGNPFHGECEVAKCCIEKGHLHCGLCEDFPCDLLTKYSCDEEHGDKPKGKRIEQCKAWKAKNLSKEVLDIRTNWAIGDAIRDSGYETLDEITRFDDIAYGPYDEWNLCDIYVKKNVTELQPTIVNIHGGGWVYGCKETYQYYCMSLAERGFTVVNINYRLAPEYRFPAPVEDINQALTFISEKGKDYFIDKDRLVLVGDSAGAQLVSHYSTIFTNHDFGAKFNLKLPDVRIKAVGLNCGAYDGRNMVLEGIESVFFEYTDCIGKEPTEELLDKLDTLKYINENFPPAFVMSCANDFLLMNAEPMYKLLQERGVEAKLKIYGTKDREEVSHVFHINIRLPEAEECNSDECDFFRKYVYNC